MALKFARVADDEDFAGCLYEAHFISRDLLGGGPGSGYLLDGNASRDSAGRFSKSPE